MSAPQHAQGAVAFPRRPIPFLIHYMARHPWLNLAVVATVALAAFSAIGSQFGMKLFVDALSAGAGGAGLGVWPAFALFLALAGAESLFWRTAGRLACRAVVAVGVDLRLDLFRHLTGQALRYFTEHMAGALANRITATAMAVSTVQGTLVWNIVPPCADFAGAVLVLSAVDWRMAVALALFVMATAGALIVFGIAGRPIHAAYADRAARVGGNLVDVMSNIWAVKAFAAARREQRRLADGLAAEAAAHRHSWLYLETLRAVHDLALWLMIAGMLGWAVHLWQGGQATVGDVMIVCTLTIRILHGSRDLAMAYVGLTQHLGRIAETLEVFAVPADIADAPDARPLIRLGGSIEFERVRFAYPDGRRVFSGLDLRVPAGQSVGIVGPSGAGKSTLISLVQRLEEIQGGDLLIDGQPIGSLSQDSLRDAIAVVPQDISLFHRSILENIRYGRPDASDQEVFAAAEAAHCDRFIRALPEGYETLVGERGVKLSGGQRQRIGIARAILKDAPVTIFDEATSALDTESEIEIQRALASLIRGRTVLAVAHRLSTVTAFDRILVMIDGRIVEDGSPAELRRQRGLFDAMWRLQAEGLALDQVP